jgi:hypothetical protein
MKKFTNLVLSAILFNCFSSFSQEKIPYKHVIVKLIPLASMDIDNTWQFAIEHRLQKAWTLSEEFGYGRYADNPWLFNRENDSKKETFRAKLEVRNYKIESAFMTGKYLGYEAYYKQVNDLIERTIPRECEGWNCNYYEKLQYGVSKYVFGGNIKFGSQGRFGSKTAPSNFIYDCFLGFGFRRIKIDHKYEGDFNTDHSNRRYGDGGLFNSYGSYDRATTLPNITVGLKFGLILF